MEPENDACVMGFRNRGEQCQTTTDIGASTKQDLTQRKLTGDRDRLEPAEVDTVAGDQVGSFGSECFGLVGVVAGFGFRHELSNTFHEAPVDVRYSFITEDRG